MLSTQNKLYFCAKELSEPLDRKELNVIAVSWCLLSIVYRTGTEGERERI